MSTKTLEPDIQSDTEQEEDITPDKGWVIVLYNDDHHTFQYVMECLCSILCISAEKALEMATRIHTSGESVVAGPMSKYEAQEIANKIAKFGPDPYSKKPKLNVGLKTSIQEA